MEETTQSSQLIPVVTQQSAVTKHLAKTCRDLLAEKCRMKEVLDNKQEELRVIQQSLNTAEQQIKKMEEIAQREKDEKSTIQNARTKSLKVYGENINKKQEEIDKLRSDAVSLKNRNIQLKTELKSVKNEVHSLEKRIQIMEEESGLMKQQMSSKLEMKNQDILKLEKKVLDQEDTFRGAQMEKQEKLKELEKLKEELKQKDVVIVGFKEELVHFNQLKDELEQKDAFIVGLKDKVKQNSKVVEEALEEMQSQMVAGIEAKDAIIKGLEDTIMEQRVEISNLKTEKQEMVDLAQNEEELNALESELAALRQERDVLSADNQRKERTIESLMKTLDETSKKVGEQNDMIIELEEQMKTRKQKTPKISPAKVRELERALMLKEQKIRLLKGENAMAFEEKEQAEGLLHEVKKKIQEKVTSVNQAQQQMAATIAEKDAQIQSLLMEKEESMALQEKVQSQQQHIGELERALERPKSTKKVTSMKMVEFEAVLAELSPEPFLNNTTDDHDDLVFIAPVITSGMESAVKNEGRFEENGRRFQLENKSMVQRLCKSDPGTEQFQIEVEKDLKSLIERYS